MIKIYYKKNSNCVQIYPTFLEGGDHWEKLDETARAQKFQKETQVIIDEAAALFGDDVVVPGLNSNLGQNTARALDALLVWLFVLYFMKGLLSRNKDHLKQINDELI